MLRAPFACVCEYPSRVHTEPRHIRNSDRLQLLFELDACRVSIFCCCQPNEKYSNSRDIKRIEKIYNEKSTANKRKLYIRFSPLVYNINCYRLVRSDTKMNNVHHRGTRFKWLFYVRSDNSIQIGFLFSAIKLK